MVLWFSDTCNCICIMESRTLIVKCNLHETFDDTVNYNKNSNLKFGENPTDKEKEIIRLEKFDKINNSSKGILAKKLSLEEKNKISITVLKHRLHESEFSKL